jgi:predicted RND superfamily exporter protein
MKVTMYLVLLMLIGIKANVYGQGKDSTIIALQNYLMKHIRYPAVARENNIQGHSCISFKVNADKVIGDIKVIQALGGTCDEEIEDNLRAFRWMSSIKPGEYVFSVNFTVEKTENYPKQSIATNEDKTDWIAAFKKKYKNYLFGITIISYDPIKFKVDTVY